MDAKLKPPLARISQRLDFTRSLGYINGLIARNCIPCLQSKSSKNRKTRSLGYVNSQIARSLPKRPDRAGKLRQAKTENHSIRVVFYFTAGLHF